MEEALYLELKSLGLTHKANHTLLERVVDLNLSGKGLSELPQEFRFFPGLKSLDLTNNNISAIDPETFASNKTLNMYM